MPRNLAGDFNLVLGNPVAPGTVIESNWANSTLNDVAAGLTESLSRSGNGGMLVPLKHTAGSAGSPSVTFLNDLKSGLYLPSNGTVIMSVGAVNRQRWTSTTVEFWNVNTSQWEKALTTGNIGPLLNINGDTADPLTNSANLKFNLSNGTNEGAVGAFNDDLNEIALASASGGAVSLRHGGTLSNARRVRTQATGARLYGDGATSTILDLYAQANDATAVAKIQFNRFDGTTPTVAGSLGLNGSATLLLDNPLDRVALTHTGTVRWATSPQGALLNENVEFISGAGSPEGVVSANAGAWYADTSSGDHYYKTGTGNAGWVALTGDLDVKSATSLGLGEPVYAQEVANEFQFKSLIAGTRIGLVSTSDDITLSTTAELNTASNLGLGEGVYAQKVAEDLQFKSLIAGTRIGLVSTSDDITLSTTAELNTASSLGLGEAVYAQKVGEDLQFKSIVAGVNVSIGSDANEITISASLDSATFTTPALITGTGVGDANQAGVKFLEVDGSTVQAELGQLDATSTTTLKSYVGDITLDAFGGTVNILNDLVSVGSITAGTDVIATGDVSGATLTVSGLATLDSLSVTNNATIGGTLGVTGDTTLSTLTTTGNTTVNGDLNVTGNLTATISELTSVVNIRGSGTGNTNASFINFNESDNLTRIGYIGDASDTDQHIYIGAELGAVKLAHTPANSADVKLATTSNGIEIIDRLIMNTASGNPPTPYTGTNIWHNSVLGTAIGGGGSQDDVTLLNQNNQTILSGGVSSTTKVRNTNGAVDVYYGSGIRLSTTTTGIGVYGSISDARIDLFGATNTNSMLNRILFFDSDSIVRAQVGFAGASYPYFIMYGLDVARIASDNAFTALTYGGLTAANDKLRTTNQGIQIFGSASQQIGNGTAGTDASSGYYFYDSASTLLGYVGSTSTASDTFYIVNSRSNAEIEMRRGPGATGDKRLTTTAEGITVFGTGTASANLKIYGAATGSPNVSYLGFYDAAGAVQGFIGLNATGDNILRINGQLDAIWMYHAGNLRVQTTSGGTHFIGNISATGTISDERIKTNVTPISDSLSLIKSIPVYNYDRKDTGENLDGIMMQDIKDKIKGAVFEGPEVEGYDGANLYPNYLPIISHLIRSIQQLNDEIESLKKAA